MRVFWGNIKYWQVADGYLFVRGNTSLAEPVVVLWLIAYYGTGFRSRHSMKNRMFDLANATT